jgi:hypothetical protein
LRHELGRIRDVRVDANGVLYVLTDGGEGMLYRVDLPHDEMLEQGKGRYRLRREFDSKDRRAHGCA